MKRLSLFKPLLKRGVLVLTAATLVVAGPAFGQNAAQPEKGYPTWFVTGLAGAQYFQLYQGENARSHTFDESFLWGTRVTWDAAKYWGLEGGLVQAYNHISIPVGNRGVFESPATNTQVTANVVGYLMPRGSKYRPYLTFGPGFEWFGPRGTANRPAGVLQTSALVRKGVPMFDYGLGVRMMHNRKFSGNLEVRGTHSGTPKFGLPAGPVAGPNTLFLPVKGTENSIYLDAGINYNLRYHEPPPVADPTRDLNLTLIFQGLDAAGAAGAGGAGGAAGTGSGSGGRSVTISGIPAQVCRGDDVRLQSSANGFGPSPAYQWLTSGQPAAGGTGPAFSVPTTNPGSTPVSLRVSGGSISATASLPEAVRAGDRLHASGAPANATLQWMLNGQPISGATSSNYTATAAANPNGYSITATVPAGPVTTSAVTVTVLPVQPPTLQFALPSTQAPYGTRIPLTATGRPVNNCNGAVTVTFSGEGVSGTTFDSSAVGGLDMSNRLKAQSKQVRITATARDARGQTATSNADVNVTLGTEARRLDDVVFQSMSSRVNNCGKRLLLETLTPLLRDDPGATVILIGHRDERERGAAGAKLDQQRVLNAAAVISAGQKICPALDMSRIRIKAAGTDQTSQTRPALCGSSVTERSGSGLKANDDRAQFRRVEVWVVPSGAAMPAGITGLTDAPAADIKKLGCPR